MYVEEILCLVNSRAGIFVTEDFFGMGGLWSFEEQ